MIAASLVFGMEYSAQALGENWGDGFASANRLDWVKDVNMSSTYLADYVDPGVSSWNAISSKVLIYKVSSGAYRVRVATENVAPTPTTTGMMTPYCAAGSIAACLTGNSTWTSAKVVGFENVMAASGFTATNRIKVFTHEFGHALSLSHVLNGSASVMAQGQSNLGIQVYDKANLKAKWGN